MNTAAVLFSPQGSFSARSVSTGASEAAKNLEGLVSEAFHQYRKRAQRDLAISELTRVTEECSQPGWDGYGAIPVSVGAADAARRFILDLPSLFNMPEIVPEPDGEISLEWDFGRWKAFSLSIGSGGKLSYAAILGRDRRANGSDNFDDVIPAHILLSLSQASSG